MKCHRENALFGDASCRVRTLVVFEPGADSIKNMKAYLSNTIEKRALGRSNNFRMKKGVC